ncbi:MAG: TRAP transporter small permease subunit [Ruthenibacterium sp.]
MNTLKKVDRVLNGARTAGLVIIMLTAIGICVINSVLRYLIRGNPLFRPFPWGDEVMRMCAIWAAFLAASLGVKENSHISIQAIVEKFVPQKLRGGLNKAAQLIVLAVLALLVVFGIIVTISMKNSSLQNLPISNAWFYASIPVGCAYLFYDYLLIFIFGEHPFAKKQQSDSDSSAIDVPAAF